MSVQRLFIVVSVLLQLGQGDFRFGGCFTKQRSNFLHNAHLLFDHFICDLNGLSAERFFFCPFVFFIGNVAHKSHYNVVAFIVNNGQLNIFLVFRQINAPVANGASALQHVEKHCRIQHADDLVCPKYLPRF